MRRALRLLFMGVALAGMMPAADAADVYSEESIKAVFLMRFAGYIDWPPEALQGPQFTIAVLGDDAVADKLEALAPGRTLKDREVRVRRLDRLEQLKDVQLLYVGAGRSADVRRLVKEPANHSLLLVTDADQGLELGSAVNFLLVDHRVRFEVSLTAAERAGLKIPAELLSVAVRVQGPGLRSEAPCLAQHARDCSHAVLWARVR